MPFYSSCASDSDGIEIYHVRQNGRQLQLLRTHNTDKTKDANFIASYQVSSSIHKDTIVIPKESLFHKLSFHV